MTSRPSSRVSFAAVQIRRVELGGRPLRRAAVLTPRGDEILRGHRLRTSDERREDPDGCGVFHFTAP